MKVNCSTRKFIRARANIMGISVGWDQKLKMISFCKTLPHLAYPWVSCHQVVVLVKVKVDLKRCHWKFYSCLDRSWTEGELWKEVDRNWQTERWMDIYMVWRNRIWKQKMNMILFPFLFVNFLCFPLLCKSSQILISNPD